MKILDVAPDSPLFGYVRPGYFIKSINGNEVIDSIDFRFKISDEKVKIDFLSAGADFLPPGRKNQRHDTSSDAAGGSVIIG